MAYDFSASNPTIKSWLDRDSENQPVREFLYLHEHPQIRPNFVTDIEVLIYETGQHMIAKNISGAPANKLVSLAETFAHRLNDFVQDRSEDGAQVVLESLRDLYRLCKKIKSI